jgi:hypothetical protein
VRKYVSGSQSGQPELSAAERDLRRHAVSFIGVAGDGEHIVIRLVVLVLFASVLTACERQAPAPIVLEAPATTAPAAGNSVVEYFAGAEIQAETDEQRGELRRAFADMLALTPDELQARRYAGFDGTRDARSLTELLTAHVVPSKPQALAPRQFFVDVKAADAQAAIRTKLHELDQSASNRPR